MYVARFTFSPEYDVRRNWSAWIGLEWDTRREALLENLVLSGVSTEDIEEAWEKWQDEEHSTYHHRDHGNYDAFLEDLADDFSIDVRHHEVMNKWLLVHHDGLSAWALDAETEEEALREARKKNFQWHGFGVQTTGEVRFVQTINDNIHLHLFWCEDVEMEM